MTLLCAVYYGLSQKVHAVMKVEGRPSRADLSETSRSSDAELNASFRISLCKNEGVFKFSHRVEWHFEIVVVLFHLMPFYYCPYIIQVTGFFSYFLTIEESCD